MPEEPSKKRLRDRYNDARENMRDNKIVQWVKDNRVPIGVGAGCLTFGYLVRGKTVHMAPTFDNTVAPVFNNTPVFNNDNSNVVNFGGRLMKIVKCVETDEKWEKVTEAAKAADTTTSYMSRHLHGHKPDVHGLHYKIIGIGTTD